MKIRLATRPVALFGAMFVIALIVLMPMRLALSIVGLGNYGLTARSVSGPVWSARLAEAHVGNVALGDLRAGLSPFALLIGRARLSVTAIGLENAARLRGVVEVSRHSFGVAGVSAGLPTGTAVAGLPVTHVDLDELSFKFADGSCAEAQGRVKAMLSGAIPGISLTQGLSGAARCDGGALLLPLTSQAGTETVNLRIKADGRYRAELIVQSTDPTLAGQLTLAGFQQTGAGYTLPIEGRF